MVTSTKPFETIYITNSLKGISIIAVLINHYLNLNVSGEYGSFASIWIVVFFILSGFGLNFSLRRRLNNGIGRQKIVKFYFDRLISIFPLFLIACVVQFFATEGGVSIWTFFGLTGEEQLWFIPAILQCYLLSPLIYWGKQRSRWVTAVVLLAAFGVTNGVLLVGLLPADVVDGVEFIEAEWRNLYFLYILFFAFGLYMSDYLPDVEDLAQKEKPRHPAWLWIGYLTIWGLMIGLKYMGYFSIIFKFTFHIFPLIPISLLCYIALRFGLQDKGSRFIGSISYPIYLFHWSFYVIIGRVGNFPQDSVSELLITLALMPLFILFCIYIDKLGGILKQLLKCLSP